GVGASPNQALQRSRRSAILMAGVRPFGGPLNAVRWAPRAVADGRRGARQRVALARTESSGGRDATLAVPTRGSGQRRASRHSLIASTKRRIAGKPFAAVEHRGGWQGAVLPARRSPHRKRATP